MDKQYMLDFLLSTAEEAKTGLVEKERQEYLFLKQGKRFKVWVTNSEMKESAIIAVDMVEQILQLLKSDSATTILLEIKKKLAIISETNIRKRVSAIAELVNEPFEKLVKRAADVMRVDGLFFSIISRTIIYDALFAVCVKLQDDLNDEHVQAASVYYIHRAILEMNSSKCD